MDERTGRGQGPHDGPLRVVKVGGRELLPGEGLETFVAWVAAAHRTGGLLLLVHGGGDEVSALCERAGIATSKVDGQRVTTPEVLPLVEGVLAGPVNHRLVSALNHAGVRALGLSGVSGEVVVARDVQGGLLGLVGEPHRVNTAFLRSLHLTGAVPVFAPLASDGHGGVLNVNADLFAAGLAEALGAELLLFTDVPGVRDRQGKVLSRLSPSSVRGLVDDGTIHGGMLPKVTAALHVLARGAPCVWIGSLGTRPFDGTLAGGTWFVPEATPSSSGSPVPSTLPLLPLRFGAGAG